MIALAVLAAALILLIGIALGVRLARMAGRPRQAELLDFIGTDAFRKARDDEFRRRWPDDLVEFDWSGFDPAVVPIFEQIARESLTAADK